MSIANGVSNVTTRASLKTLLAQNGVFLYVSNAKRIFNKIIVERKHRGSFFNTERPELAVYFDPTEPNPHLIPKKGFDSYQQWSSLPLVPHLHFPQSSFPESVFL